MAERKLYSRKIASFMKADQCGNTDNKSDAPKLDTLKPRDNSGEYYFGQPMQRKNSFKSNMQFASHNVT